MDIQNAETYTRCVVYYLFDTEWRCALKIIISCCLTTFPLYTAALPSNITNALACRRNGMSWIVLVTFSIRIWIKSKNRPCKSTTIDKSRAIGKISSHNVTVKTIIQDKLIAMTRNLTIVVRTHSSLLYYKSMRSIKNIYTRTDILRFIYSSVTVLTGARRSKSTEIWNFSFFFTVRWNRFLKGLMWQRGIGFITYIREKPGKFFLYELHRSSNSWFNGGDDEKIHSWLTSRNKKLKILWKKNVFTSSSS